MLIDDREMRSFMAKYLIKIKTTVYILASVGHSVSEEDQILHILARLGSEYDASIVYVTKRIEILHLQVICAMKLAHECFRN